MIPCSGLPNSLIHLHHIRQEAAGLVSQRFEVIDGQQRINALGDYVDGAFRLFDPEKDAAEARFPDFIKRQPCPWGNRTFEQLEKSDQTKLLETSLRIVKIETQ